MATTALKELQAHLQKVAEEPSTKFDLKLLEQSELYFSSLETGYATSQAQLLESLFDQIAQLLPTLQQDPSPLNRVILKLSAQLTFDHVIKLDLLPGLDLSASPFHEVTLNLLEKALSKPANVELIASQPDLIAAIIKVWLCAEDTGASSKAGTLLVNFLKLSKNLPEPLHAADTPTVYGNGPMWKRVFGDKDIFRLFLSICSLEKSVESPVELSRNQRTVAQARLLDWLPQVGVLDWDTLLKCHHVDIATDYGLGIGDGLLTFAAEKMIDYEDDVLMHISLINFYSDLIRTVRKKVTNDMSNSLQYLISRRLHHRAMSYWLTPDPENPLEGSYLSGPSAQYISTYASWYPEHFESSGLVEVQAKLLSCLDLSPGRWAQGQSPKYELHVLASLPRTFIFPADASTQSFRNSPLSLVPCKTTNEDALNTLATIFQGPPSPRPSLIETIPPPSDHDAVLVEPSESRWLLEAEAAAGLFWLYLAENNNLFTELIRHAEIVALKEKALAAINFMHAIATAKWAVDVPSDDSTINATSDNAAQAHARVFALTSANPSLPKTGIEALLHGPVRNIVFPYLLKPPTKFSNLVGGHGDAESAAYRIATSKFDLVSAVYKGLEDLEANNPQNKEWNGLTKALKQRVSEGPWGVGGEVGGRIATMEL